MQEADQVKDKKGRGRIPGAFIDEEMNDEFENEDQSEAQKLRVERMRTIRQQQETTEDQLMQDVIDYEEVRGKRSLWIQRPEVIKWIRKAFLHFLRTCQDD